MKSWGRIISGVVVGSVLLTGTAAASVAAKSKAVSAEKYAKTLCSSYDDITGDILTAFADEYAAITEPDPATYQIRATEVVGGFVDQLTAIRNKLKKTSPDIDDGKKIAKKFIVDLDDFVGKITDALDTFAAADASSPAFTADATQLQVSLQLAGTQLGAPFNEINDQDLLEAFDDEKSCEGIVTVF